MTIEPHLHAPVQVRPICRHAPGPQALERLGCRVPIVVVGTDGDDGHARPGGIEECRSRRGARAVVGDLEQVHARQPTPDERRIDVLFHVAGEQEPLAVGRAEQHHRGVVDRLAVIEWRTRNGAGVRPQDREPDGVEREVVAGHERGRAPATDECGGPRLVPGSPPGQPRLVHLPDPVARQHDREPGDVVLVRVRQDHQVEAPIPRWEALVECLEQSVGIRPAVDDHSSAAIALDEDRVALPDVEHRHPDGAIRPVGNRKAERDGRSGEAQPGKPPRAR